MIVQRQHDCFSYVVSIDGVHVCHPQNIIEYEGTVEEETESDPQNLVEYEGTGEEETESDPQSLVKYEGTGEEETESDSQSLVKYETTEAAAPECERPSSLLQRRGKSISGLRLALSTSTQSTLVDLSGYEASETNIADHPNGKSDEYELIKLIGIDGEGVVHLMRSQSTRQLIVRKTVKHAKSIGAKPIEAAILQDLFPDRHDNIIRLAAFDTYRVDGARYYLEYCAGGDLHQLVRQYRNHAVLLPELFLWQAFQQLASALEFLHRGFDPRCTDPHRRAICHRDIKPSNIFLRLQSDSVYPDVVLADFGHATLRFATYDPAGTAMWQPPELPRHSPKGDVYSLGAVMHFLIHFEAPVAKLPDGVADTESARDAWAAAPEARRPRMEFVEGYSEDLVCAMLTALEADETKRKNSSQLLTFVSGCVEEMFPPGSDLLRKAEQWPMARWAFDHMDMMPAGGRFEEEEDDTGTEQYFQMMEIFGCGRSRESSRVSFPAPSDRRRGVAGSRSRELETCSVSSLGEA